MDNKKKVMYACECNVGQTTRVIRFNPGFSVPENKIEKLKTTYSNYFVPVLIYQIMLTQILKAQAFMHGRWFGRYHTNNTPH